LSQIIYPHPGASKSGASKPNTQSTTLSTLQASSESNGSANTYNDGVSTAHQAVGSFTVMGWHGTNGTATDHERFYVVVFGD
jgi:hypothetical protein